MNSKILAPRGWNLQRFDEAVDFYDPWKPEFWATATEKVGLGKYNYQNMVSRRFESTLANKGKKITVPIQEDVKDPADYTSGSNITFSTSTAGTVDVELNRSKVNAFKLNQDDLTFSAVDLIMDKAVPQLDGLLREMNRFVYAELLVKFFVGSPGNVNDFKVIADLRTLMNDNDAPEEPRMLVLSNKHEGDFLKDEVFVQVNTSGDRLAQEQGIIGTKFGFSISRNSANVDYVPADLVGAINNGAGFVIGDTTIIVDGFDDDANPIRKGDMFIIAGETGTPDHTVISTTVTTLDTTGITFFPALVGAVADNAVVTFTPSQSSVAFLPSSFALAAAPYRPFAPGTPGIAQTITDYQGFPILVTVTTDPDSYVMQVSYISLYGGSVLDEEKMARIVS